MKYLSGGGESDSSNPLSPVLGKIYNWLTHNPKGTR